MSRLSQLSLRLQQVVGDAHFAFINTRVVLRTGVNLRQVHPSQEDDEGLLERVKQVLREMGYLEEEVEG